MLERIQSPEDLRELPIDELPPLAEEIRKKILDTVSENGGHLASNLGTVELTLALHYVFDTPRDTIVFDVGHQCYTHKLITGRRDVFGTLRQTGGLSGFSNREESVYDTVTAGHSGPSVSAALGIAHSKKLRGEDSYTVAVAGDGSFTNGMIYEALNNCAERGLKLIVVLNDNGMSISDNVGGLSKYLSRVRTSGRYFSFKYRLKRFFMHVPLIGRHLVRGARRIKEAVKRLFLNTNMFESLGLEYLGPVDGNDIKKLLRVLGEAKTREECTLVHVKTKKGLGYPFSEADPGKYHFTPPFDTGEGVAASGRSFTSAVSDTLCEMGGEDDKICAVTAAMPEGTGLSAFAEKFPDRFFDVGIAEEHAVTFASGLAIGGMKPVCAIYSTFAERAFDQLLHDVSMQKLPFTLLVSHAGFVAGDGCSHQGIFDTALFSAIPSVAIYEPDSYAELDGMIRGSVGSGSIDVIRYPKGREAVYPREKFAKRGDFTFSYGTDGADAVILTHGRLTAHAAGAAEIASADAAVGVVRVSRLFPVPTDEILPLLEGAGSVIIADEGVLSGGWCEIVSSALTEAGYRGKTVSVAVGGEFPPHGDLDSLFKMYGLDADGLAEKALDSLKDDK